MIYAIKARLFKGRKNYNENGVITSANQLIDLPITGSLEWRNFMKRVRHAGYTDMEVVKCSSVTYENHRPVLTECEAPEEIVNEIKEAFRNTVKKVLTPEQREIAELKAQMAAMIEANKAPKTPANDDTPDINEELEAARDRYKELFGKKPSHLMKLSTLNQKIEEELNK